MYRKQNNMLLQYDFDILREKKRERRWKILFFCCVIEHQTICRFFFFSILSQVRSFCVKWLRILPCNCLLLSCYDEIFRWCSHKSNQFVCRFLRNALKTNFVWKYLSVKIFEVKWFISTHFKSASLSLKSREKNIIKYTHWSSFNYSKEKNYINTAHVIVIY